MIRERDIVCERGEFWALRIAAGHYQVLKNSSLGTHAVVCSTVQFSDDDQKARAKAIEDCDRRAAEEKGS